MFLEVVPAPRIARRGNSFGQPLSPGFNGEGNDQQSDHEGDGGGPHGNSQTAVAVNHRSQHEIDAGADETAEGGCESERGGAHRRAVLLGQPQTEGREIAAEETEEEKYGNENDQTIGKIERPAEAQPDTYRHADEVNRQGRAAAD